MTTENPPIPPPKVDRWGTVAPTDKESRAANAGEYAPKGFQRLLLNVTNNWAVRLGVAGGGAYLAYQNIPAIQEFVDARYNDILQKLGIEINVPDTFNNASKEGVIGEANTIALPLEQIQELLPQQVVEADHRLTFLFPFQLPEGAKVKYQRSFTLNHPTPEAEAEAIKNRVNDIVGFNLPEGTTIVAPVTGHLNMGGPLDEPGDNPNLVPGGGILFYDQNRNITYNILFSGGGFDRNLFEPLQPISPLNINHTGLEWKELPVIEQGEPILGLPRDREVKISISAYRGDNIGYDAVRVDNAFFRLTPDFITDQGKVVVLQN